MCFTSTSLMYVSMEGQKTNSNVILLVSSTVLFVLWNRVFYWLVTQRSMTCPISASQGLWSQAGVTTPSFFFFFFFLKHGFWIPHSEPHACRASHLLTVLSPLPSTSSFYYSVHSGITIHCTKQKRDNSLGFCISLTVQREVHFWCGGAWSLANF
jgi:hypothetical protein